MKKIVVRPSLVLRALGVCGAKTRGVFAAIDLPAGTPLGRYAGFIVCKDSDPRVSDIVDAMWAQGTASYLLTADGLVVDGIRRPQNPVEQMRVTGRRSPTFRKAEWPGNYLHLMNDPRGLRIRSSVTIDHKGYAYTKRFIPAYDPRNPSIRSELTFSYQQSYWDGHDEFSKR